MKKLFFIMMILILNQCGNPKSPYPTANDLADNQGENHYSTYTLLLYDKPFQSELLYSFFYFLEQNNLNISFFMPLDINATTFEAQIKKILKSVGSQPLNIIYIRVSEDDIRKKFPKLSKKAKKRIHLFPYKKVKQEAHQSIVLPENYNYNAYTSQIILSLQNADFLGNLLKNLSDSYVTKKNKKIEEGNIVYIQGESYKEVAIDFLIKSKMDPFQLQKASMSSDKGDVFGLSSKNTNTMLVQVKNKKKYQSYYILNLKNSFLFFDFKTYEENGIGIHSFFKPMDLNLITVAQKKLRISKNFPIYHIKIKRGSKESSDEIIGNYNRGILTFELSRGLFPISYQINKESALQIDVNSILYDFDLGKSSNKKKLENLEQQEKITIRLE